MFIYCDKFGAILDKKVLIGTKKFWYLQINWHIDAPGIGNLIADTDKGSVVMSLFNLNLLETLF